MIQSSLCPPTQSEPVRIPFFAQKKKSFPQNLGKPGKVTSISLSFFLLASCLSGLPVRAPGLPGDPVYLMCKCLLKICRIYFEEKDRRTSCLFFHSISKPSRHIKIMEAANNQNSKQIKYDSLVIKKAEPLLNYYHFIRMRKDQGNTVSD